MSITYKALLIGNSDFEDENLQNLNGPVTDVKLLKEALCHETKGLFLESNVTTVVNETKQEILNKMESFFQNTTYKDQIIFYYSGHGFLEGTNMLFLCAKDSKKHKLISTAIPEFSLKSMLYNCACRKRIILLDCCNSGRFKGGNIAENLSGEGQFVITSGRGKDLANDANDPGKPSPFTKHLVNGMLNDDLDINNDGFVSVTELYQYVDEHLHQETKLRPGQSFDNVKGDLPICKRENDDGKKQDKQIKEIFTERDQKPKIDVSEQSITHRLVEYEEELNADIIYVFNEGGGKLNWDVTTEFDWIKIKKDDTLFYVTYEKKEGKHRGTIRVADKNGGGTKTIRVLVERLKKKEEKQVEEPETQKKLAEIVAPLKNYQKQDGNKNEPKSHKLLKSFQSVNMRDPSQAKAIVDNGEQSGMLYVYEDRIEFRGKVTHEITSIENLSYFPQEINPGYTFNYMGITGEYDGVKKQMHFYNFSWLGAGQTWKMIEQIYQLIRNKQLAVSDEFSSHMEQDSTLHKKTNTQPTESYQPPVQDHRIYMPGRWQITMFQYGQQVGTLNLYFSKNGSLNGSQQSNTGFSQVNGTWSFNESLNRLSYWVTVTTFSGPVPETGSIDITHQDGKLSGTDSFGRYWVLHKTGN